MIDQAFEKGQEVKEMTKEAVKPYIDQISERLQTIDQTYPEKSTYA